MDTAAAHSTHKRIRAGSINSHMRLWLIIDARPAICQLDEEKNKYNTQHIQYTFRFNISNDYAI